MKHLKKILAIVLIAVSLFAIALPALAEYGIFNTGGIKLRNGPNSSTYYGYVMSGTRCSILSTQADSTGANWMKVTIDSRDRNNGTNASLTMYTGWVPDWCISPN